MLQLYVIEVYHLEIPRRITLHGFALTSWSISTWRKCVFKVDANQRRLIGTYVYSSWLYHMSKLRCWLLKCTVLYVCRTVQNILGDI